MRESTSIYADISIPMRALIKKFCKNDRNVPVVKLH